MSRIEAVSREALTPEGQATWDRIASGRNGRVGGPYTALLHVPGLADRVRALGDYFRGDAELPPADIELAILTTVREAGARYAWARHEVRAREVGTRTEAIEALRANGPLDRLSPHERLVVETARSLLRTRALDDALYARAREELGERQLVELVTLVGHYSLIGFILNGFEIPPPPEGPTYD
jgi:4-carboxymuconolactone decarboxylase